MCVKIELTKIIKSKSFIFIAIIFYFDAILNFILTCNANKNLELSKIFDASKYSLLINDTQTPFKSIFDILLPLVVCLIASDSFAIDRKYGINNSIFSRINKRNYLLSKTIAILIISFLCVVIPLLINTILIYTAFPSTGNCTGGTLIYSNYTNTDPERVLSYIEAFYPILNIIIHILIRGFYAAGCAILAYGLTCRNLVNRYIAVITPISLHFLFVCCSTLVISNSENVLINKIASSDVLSINYYGSIWIIIGIVSLIYIISFLMILTSVKKDELND